MHGNNARRLGVGLLPIAAVNTLPYGKWTGTIRPVCTVAGRVQRTRKNPAARRV